MTKAYIHTTDRTTFKSCRLKWHFTSPLRLNLEPVRGQPALTFGTAIHAGLEAYYDPQYESRSRVRADKAFVESLDKWFKKIPNATVEDKERYDEHLDLGYGMLNHYFNYANKEDDFEVVSVEEHIKFPVPDINPADYGLEEIIYSFRMDMVIRDRKGKFWIWDNKTAADLHDDITWLMMDDQIGSYIWGYQATTNIKIEGFVYNVLRKAYPKLLKRNKNNSFSVDKRQNTTYEIASKQLIKEYGEIPDYAKELMETLKAQGNKFFQREIIRRNPGEIAALGKSIVMEAIDMVNSPSIYRTPNKYNCNWCAFVAPCMVYYEGGDLEAALSGGYRPNERDDDKIEAKKVVDKIMEDL